MSFFIKNKDFIVHRKYYEQLYLYSQIWDFDPEASKNKGLDYGEHIHINDYINVFKKNVEVLEKGLKESITLVGQRELDFSKGTYYEKEIEKKCIEFRESLIKEWLEHSKDLTFENFYEKNYQMLNMVNSYVLKEVENYAKKA